MSEGTNKSTDVLRHLPPGPYTANELGCKDHQGQGWIKDADGRDITGYGDHTLTTEANQALGCLFAAAPELYTSLQELIACKALKDHIDEQDLNYASDEYREYVQRKRKAWDAARTAIAKAQGFV